MENISGKRDKMKVIRLSKNGNVKYCDILSPEIEKNWHN